MQVLVKPKEKLKLDAIDKKILLVKCKNTRTPVSRIGKMVGLSKDGVRYRLKRMQEAGLLVGSRTVINPLPLGYRTWHLLVSLDSQGKANKAAIIKRFCESEYVNALISYEGHYDMDVVVIASGVEQMDAILRKLLPQGVAGYELLSVVDYLKRGSLPEGLLDAKLLEEGRRNDRSFHKDFSFRRKHGFKLEQAHIRVLEQLADDGEKPMTDIAGSLGASKDGISRKVRELIDAGIIESFIPVINLSALNIAVYALVARLEGYGDKTKDDLVSWLRSSKNVYWAGRTLGKWSVMCYILVSAPDEVHAVVEDFRTRFRGLIKEDELLLAAENPKYSYWTPAMGKELAAQQARK
jgi:Lrp/AsnC family transcriptional regulator for asnA, asnC and gidA